MRPRTPLRALVLLSFVLPSVAGAQSYSDPGLGFGAGFSLSEGRSADGPSAGGEIHLRYRMTGSLGLEGRVAFRRETLDDGKGPLLDVVELPVTGTGQLFFLPRARVQPYLLAGAGLHVVRTKPKGRNEAIGGATEALFAIHVGTGLDVRPTRSSAVHLDARWFFLEPTAVTDLVAAGFDVRPGYLSVSLGVTFFR